MATWINPLDKVPQIRQDIANHIIYGGLLGQVATIISEYLFHSGSLRAWLIGFLVTLLVAGGKKAVDYFKEQETLAVVVSKTFITAAIPLVSLIVHRIGM